MVFTFMLHSSSVGLVFKQQKVTGSSFALSVPIGQLKINFVPTPNYVPKT